MSSYNLKYSTSIVFLDYPKANIYSQDEITRMSNLLEESNLYFAVKYPYSDRWITNYNNPNKCRLLLKRYKLQYDRIYYISSIYPVLTSVTLHRNYSPSKDFVLIFDSIVFAEEEKITLNGLGIVSNNYVIGCDSRDKESLFFLWKLSKLFGTTIEFTAGVTNGCSVLSLLQGFEALNINILNTIYDGGF